MFNPKKYFQAENLKCQASYRKTLTQIKKIHRATAQEPKRRELQEYYKLFHLLSGLILEAAEKEKILKPKYFSTRPFEMLQEENRRLFQDILPENYEASYANPSCSVKVFGDGFGQLMSFFYQRYQAYNYYAWLHLKFQMERSNRVFIEVFEHLKKNPLDYPSLKEAVIADASQPRLEDINWQIKQSFDPGFGFYHDILMKSDLSDPRYLFSYGRYINENEIQVAKFLAHYPRVRIKRLARQIVASFLQGFRRDNKERGQRDAVILVYPAGYEAIARQVVREMKKAGLKALVPQPRGCRFNEQYIYDHRFDEALYLDEEFVADMLRNYSQAAEERKNLLERFCGVIALDRFGDPPFFPQDKPEALKYSPEQLPLRQRLAAETTAIHERYCPRRKTSFTVISFPAPEIGSHFEQIFEDILEINLLDPRKHSRLQARIISVLDRADRVIIEGRDGNRTRMVVKLPPLADPHKQSNFVNCGADVNIPLGEVFTSPRLAGTSGRLHIDQAYLKGLKFKDLELEFRDGYIADYRCANFPDPLQNRKYIEENLLFPYKTLPLGEFAIGTNTLAYVLAKKHGIMELLPVLIIEKMGPHFAIGDTCFVREEDHPIFNPDGKEVVARENEKTSLRHQDRHQAYTQVHTDITLPYESIGRIAAIYANGRQVDIIRNGRFVLKGTEALNRPFDG